MTQFQSSVVIVNLVYVSDEQGVLIQKPVGKDLAFETVGRWHPLEGLSTMSVIPATDRLRLALACALAFADQRPTT